jgi:hypothetical protein
MASSAAFLRIVLTGAALFALAACATGTAFTKEQLETTLNDELMTGASSADIQAFFERHEFPYSYDAMLRRYRSTLNAGTNRKFDIYIYTDNERKLTIAQIIGTETPKSRPVTSLPPGLNTTRDGRF